jgi:1,2-diacylglycerol 3-alpha-glucosyltransferase
MKIGMLTDNWLPSRDGVVNSILSFKKEFELLGHEVYIFAAGKYEYNDFEERIFYYKSRPVKGYTSFKMAITPTPFFQRTQQLVKELKLDILHSHSPGPVGVRGIAVSYKLEIPFIFTYHTYVPDIARNLPLDVPSELVMQPLLDSWIRWYFRQSDAVIVPTESRAKEIRSEAKPGEIKNLFVVPTGIDINKFNKFRKTGTKRVRAKYGLENKQVILHVGRIVKEKNLGLILAAAPYILDQTDTVFVLVGDGPVKKDLEERVKALGFDNRFIFTGFVSEEELNDFYHSADILLFPSTFETQGLVVLEAMASGLPCAVANAAPFKDFINDGENAFLFSPTDPVDCARVVIQALEEGKNVKENAKRTAARFNPKECAAKLIDIYKQIIELKRKENETKSRKGTRETT